MSASSLQPDLQPEVRISAREALLEYPEWKRLDVRSEGEFRQGEIPGFSNFPILTNPERHEVGLTYRQQGQDQAVRLGYDLVGPVKDSRVDQWVSEVRSANASGAIVACWRGGMRSQIASQWIRERGVEVLRVQGGTQALRRVLFASLEAPPELLVLGGMTGSGKTELLPESQVPYVDLEALAEHRGSSFGRYLGRIQPSQQTFENRLGIALLLNSVKNPGGQLLVEDESTYIGGVTVPGVFRKQMRSSQVVLLEVSLDERAEWIRKLYVEAPISSGVTEFALKSHFSEALLRIRSKLGGLRHDQIRRQIGEAKSPDEHRDWIRSLLEEYYDPLYRYSLEKDARAVIFRGNREEVREWLKIHDQAH